MEMARLPETVHLLLLSAGLAFFGIACFQDWAIRLVSNRIPAAIASIGIVLRIADRNIASSLIAAISVFLVTAFCWRRRWLGGADVKLFVAGTLLMPPSETTNFIFASCLAGGCLALVYGALGFVVPTPSVSQPISRLGRYVRVEQRRLHRRGPIPYATAIAAGACFVALGG